MEYNPRHMRWLGVDRASSPFGERLLAYARQLGNQEAVRSAVIDLAEFGQIHCPQHLAEQVRAATPVPVLMSDEPGGYVRIEVVR